MRLQTITYRGRPVACATATRFFLADDLDRLPAGDPVLTFVIYMCAYARDVLTGELELNAASIVRFEAQVKLQQAVGALEDAVQRPLANWPDLEQGRTAQVKQEKP